MGTRSLTFVHDSFGQIFVNMYRQFDGYREGHGRELAAFLNSFDAVTNGIQTGGSRKTANGMFCLAAQMIAHFKRDAGQFYLHHPDERNLWQEYEYHIYQDRVEVVAYDKTIFIGSWREFYEWTYTPAPVGE